MIFGQSAQGTSKAHSKWGSHCYSETSTNSSKNPPETFSFVPFLPPRREICCKTEPRDQDTDATSLETLERAWEAGKGRSFLNQGQQFRWSHREETTEAARGGEATAGVSTGREKRLHPFSETDLKKAATSFPLLWTSGSTHTLATYKSNIHRNV